jgi:RNA polymerase sigma-70 factor (ECF subfamily)
MKEQEFLALVNSCKGMVFKLIHYYTDDPEEAKDWLQEILFQSWKSFPKFNKESKFSTWFYSIAVKTILSQRKAYSITTVEVKEIEQTSSNLDRFEDKEKLDWAIKQLNPEDRFLIHLSFEGYSQEEIAGMVGINPNAIGVKNFRIKRQLRNILKNHE